MHQLLDQFPVALLENIVMRRHHGNAVCLRLNELLRFVDGICRILECPGDQIQFAGMLEDIARCKQTRYGRFAIGSAGNIAAVSDFNIQAALFGAPYFMYLLLKK
jgi:hypothetical protein